MSLFDDRFSTVQLIPCRCARRKILSLSLVVYLISAAISADDKDPAAVEVKVAEIADEPKLIDPATVMPPQLAKPVTVDLSESSLREVVEWLRTEQKLLVLTESSALAEAGVQSGEPISDRLDNAPIYLLLNRLSGGFAYIQAQGPKRP